MANKAIPRELIEKRKEVVQHLLDLHNDDTDFDRGVRATLREELTCLKDILGELVR